MVGLTVMICCLIEVQGGPAAGGREELPLLLPGEVLVIISCLFLPHKHVRPSSFCLHVLQLLRGGSEEMLKSLHLQKDPAAYVFIREGAAAAVSSSPSCLTVLLLS